MKANWTHRHSLLRNMFAIALSVVVFAQVFALTSFHASHSQLTTSAAEGVELTAQSIHPCQDHDQSDNKSNDHGCCDHCILTSQFVHDFNLIGMVAVVDILLPPKKTGAIDYIVDARRIVPQSGIFESWSATSPPIA